MEYRREVERCRLLARIMCVLLMADAIMRSMAIARSGIPGNVSIAGSAAFPINEYFNQMAVEDKADFFADVMACEACPKKDGCMYMDKFGNDDAHNGCVQRMDEWLHEKVQKEA